MTNLGQIAKTVPGALLRGDPTVEVTGATHDSRAVKPGFLFAVLSGSKTDGRNYIEAAAKAGAKALLVDNPVECELPQIVVGDTRDALGVVAAAAYGDPTSRLKVAAVTGTNGKTTTAYLVESALIAADARPGVMSTVEYRFGQKRWEATHTTPEATTIQAMAREMLDAKATHLVMEASSHGLFLGRLNGCRFDVVAFTNLTQDHLDFHKNMRDYGLAKLKLFTSCIAGEPDAKAVINLDDPFGAEILKHLTHPRLTFSVNAGSQADIRPAAAPRYGIDGIEARALVSGSEHRLVSPLLGPHNLSNLFTALGICVQLGMKPEQACAGLSKVDKVPGRLERVGSGGELAVLVDYAHTPDALERALKCLRPLTGGRLIAVFGCGGDRDSAKRPLMGKAVGRDSDIAIVTSDNPRTEQPESIIDMILPGIDESGMPRISSGRLAQTKRGYAVEPDRSLAIEAAINAARPGDTVLIAGKGHEDYQILGTTKIHFDDREKAVQALKKLTRGENHV